VLSEAKIQEREKALGALPVDGARYTEEGMKGANA